MSDRSTDTSFAKHISEIVGMINFISSKRRRTQANASFSPRLRYSREIHTRTDTTL